MGASNIAEILELVKTAQAASVDEITKNFTQPGSATAGIQGYDLEAPSKKLYPVLTPLRNKIPRRGGGFATQANWKAITGIRAASGSRVGVSEGQRGGTNQHTVAEYFAAYRGIGGEKSVTFEADYASKGFEDVKALAVQQALENLMIGEEMLILGGNTSLSYGTTPTPVLVGSGTGGTLAANTWSVICIALSLQAYWDLAGMNNGATGQTFDASTAVINGTVTRTNADGTTDTINMGVAKRSNAATVVTTGATSSIAATVTPVTGAVAYAWFWGVAGSERLAALTTINSVSITAAANGAAQLASDTGTSGDRSTSSLDFDGLLTIASKGLGSYYRALPTGVAGTGTSLTQAGGRIVEIDTALADFYSKYRLQPTEIHLSFIQFQKITNLILGSTNPNVMFTVNVNDPVTAIAGRNVGKYVSPITGQIIELVVHPNMPPGTMFFYTATAPAYLDGVQDMCRIRTRRDYYQLEWPLRTRKYEYGVYADEVLQHFFPPSLGVITNIG
jgi:hypothetical protein